MDVGRYLKQYLDEVRQGGKIKAKYSLSSVVVTNLPSSEEPEESIEEELEHFSEGGKTEFTDSV